MTTPNPFIRLVQDALRPGRSPEIAAANLLDQYLSASEPDRIDFAAALIMHLTAASAAQKQDDRTERLPG